MSRATAPIVYVVSESHFQEGHQLDQVFATRALAEEYVAREAPLIPAGEYGPHYELEIEEREVLESLPPR